MTSSGEATFEAQVAQLLPRLRRFAFALTRHPADGDDLAAMAIERALRARTQWQPGTRLDSWLFRITRNVWIDEIRSRQRKARQEAPPDAANDVGVDPRPGLEAALDLQRVMAAMGRLPDEQREVVALILVEGFGYRETAELLDLPIGTVSSRLVRGRTALLELLGEGKA
ncbi:MULTISPECIES: RNA polymerase sigma factor [Sphingomonas]|uniref:RNA polymerase sigma factor n=1 Tax=Sphingomonas TaxID=13687 RepID=UPI000DEF9582|nr:MULTISPECIES: RNA polymerase sigma factor [Sphingomonas]